MQTNRPRKTVLQPERSEVIKDALSAGLCKANPFFMRIQYWQLNQHAAQQAGMQAADLTAIPAFGRIRLSRAHYLMVRCLGQLKY